MFSVLFGLVAVAPFLGTKSSSLEADAQLSASDMPGFVSFIYIYTLGNVNGVRIAVKSAVIYFTSRKNSYRYHRM